MRRTNVDTGSAQSTSVTTGERGGAIARRRRDLGIKSQRALAEATGLDRGTVKRAEEGDASESTYALLEQWLARQEEEMGVDEPTPADPSPIRVTFHDVSTSSIGEIIVEGPSDHPDDLIATIAKLLAEVRKSGTD